METIAQVFWGIAALYTAVKFMRSVQLVPTQSAYIVERFGRYHATLGPGFHVLIPFFDKVAYIQDLKEEAIEVPPQECFTKDNVQVEVDGVLYLTVMNPVNASYGITDFKNGAIQLVQTTTRSVIGTIELDRTFEERDLINMRVLKALGEVSDAWGIQVHRYEVKGIVPPASVRDAMERQMTAERERRAVIARSEADKQGRINESEGIKQEMINRSEGEKQKRVNEAEGRASEILQIAAATAEGIEKMGDALTSEGGAAAMKLRLSQMYVQKLGALAKKDTEIILPADLGNLDAILTNMGLNLTDADRATMSTSGQKTISATAKTIATPAPRQTIDPAATLPEMAPIKR